MVALGSRPGDGVRSPPEALARKMPPMTVAVAPLGGAPRAATDILISGLRTLPGLTVVDVGRLEDAFADGVAVDRCPDDRCRLAAASKVAFDRLIVGELAPGPLDGRRTLRIRLLLPKVGAAPEVRVSQEVGSEGLEAALRLVLSELFPMRVVRSSSPVIIKNLPAQARVRFDRTTELTLEGNGGRLVTRLAPGAHTVEARAPGHDPWTAEFEVRVGTPTRVDAGLSKRRSAGPLIIGIGGVLAVGVGVGLAALANARSDDWEVACAGGPCGRSFTRARYLDDQAALDRESTAANILFAVGGAALVTGLVWFLIDPGSDGPESFFSDRGDSR